MLGLVVVALVVVDVGDGVCGGGGGVGVVGGAVGGVDMDGSAVGGVAVFCFVLVCYVAVAVGGGG